MSIGEALGQYILQTYNKKFGIFNSVEPLPLISSTPVEIITSKGNSKLSPHYLLCVQLLGEETLYTGWPKK